MLPECSLNVQLEEKAPTERLDKRQKKQRTLDARRTRPNNKVHISGEGPDDATTINIVTDTHTIVASTHTELKVAESDDDSESDGAEKVAAWEPTRIIKG
jgi:anthranilate phosphoribosyltransferase